MIRSTTLLGLALSSCLLLGVAACQTDNGAPYPMLEAHYDMRAEQAVRVPMRDGVRLSTDLYHPDGASGSLPVILIRTPYDKGAFRAGFLGDVVRMFVGQGYVVAVQDKRGRFESEGIYSLAVKEDVDGYDTVEWLAGQSWSNGKVGTYGCSDLGDAQVWMAPARPPSLAAMIPQASGSVLGPADNIYRYFGTYNGGAFHLAAAAGWMVGNGSKVFFQPPSHVSDEEFSRIAHHFSPGPVNAPAVDLNSIMQSLPLVDMMKKANRPYTDWESIVTYDLADPWWDQFPYYKGHEQIDVPSLFVNSWHDFGVNETLWEFNYFRENAVSSTARDNQFVVISPTPHCASERIRAPTMVGERDLGDARYDLWTLYVRWYDRWLKGEQNGVTDMPRVQYYLMGKNEWRAADEWPITGTRFTKYYLASGGRANSLNGDGVLSTEPPQAEAADRFTYDPASPVPSMSGSYGMTEGFYDQRPVEERDDVLVYTTPPLADGFELTGPITATLYVSSDARDTDFTAKLVDVQPDGTAYFLQEGILRARYREGFHQKVFMEQGEVYELTISLDATSNYFPAGHRIRLEVSSSNFPRFDRNLNTGGSHYDEVEWVVAHNAVHHSAQYPSHVVLPIVPAGASRALDLASEPGRSLSPEATAALVERFQAELDAAWTQAQGTDENFPGATAAFILPDGRVFGFATGESDVDDDIPMTPDLRMGSGSIGKTYVAAVALQLAMNGELDLDAPVSTWLGDEEWFARVPNYTDLTVRNLLNHTAGMIQPYFEDPDFASRLGEVFSDPDGYMTPEQFVAESVLDDEPLFPAGQGYHYSDVHYTLAGLAIEEATGREYYDLLDEFFLDPFELDLTLPADRRDLPGLAQGYAHASSELFGVPLEVVADGRMVIHPLQEWTGGGLVNNPQALVRWAKLLYEGEAIDGDDLPQLFDIGFPTDSMKPHLGYGLGVFVQESEHGITYGHAGFFFGYNSLVTYYSDHDVAVAIQINSDDSQMYRHGATLASVVLEALADTGR